MTTKQKTGCIGAVLQVLIVSPIWLYLLYSVFKAIEATDLQWFLFWIYVPVCILTGIIRAIATVDE